MPKQISEETKAAVLLDYANPEINMRALCSKYGLSPNTVYQYAHKAGVKKGQPLSTGYPQPVDNSAPNGHSDSVSQPPATPVTSATSPSTPAVHTPDVLPAVAPTGLTCPLFPARKPNEIDHLEIRRVITSPPQDCGRLGGGLILEHADVGFDESAIRSAYGGGRYEVRAINGQGRELARKALHIHGRSLPIDPEMGNVAEEQAPVQMTPNGPVVLSQPLGPMMELIRQQSDSTRLLIERMEAMQTERSLEKDKFYEMTMQQQRDFSSQQLMMVKEMFAAKGQEKPLIGQLGDALAIFKTVKELTGAETEDKNPFVAAIDKLPDIISGAAHLIHGPQALQTDEDFDEDDEEEEQEGDAPASDGPTAPGTGNARANEAQPRSYDAIARQLYARLLADGVPQPKAMQMVQRGFGLIKMEIAGAVPQQAQAPRPPVIKRPVAPVVVKAPVVEKPVEAPKPPIEVTAQPVPTPENGKPAEATP